MLLLLELDFSGLDDDSELLDDSLILTDGYSTQISMVKVETQIESPSWFLISSNVSVIPSLKASIKFAFSKVIVG